MAEKRILRQAQEEQIAIMDSLAAMIWYRDRNGKVLRCNRSAAQSIGLTVGEMEGRTIFELYPDEAAEYHREDLKVIDTGKPMLGLVKRIRLLNPAPQWFQIDKFPFRNERGQIVGVIVIAVDVTPRKVAEDILRDNDRALRDFVANVSHEFRTPVAAIRGFAETLRDRGVKDEKHRHDFLKTIIKHADRLAWLIEELLALSSLEARSLKLNLEAIAIRDAAQAAIHDLSSHLRKRKVRALMSVPAGLKIRADEKYLTQALENVLSNAIKFSPKNSLIRITAKKERRSVVIQVQDHGSGIAKEDLPHIFERFYRGINARGKEGHTGLGLHIVKKIMAVHEGGIWAESREGEGSTFFLRFPAA